VPDPKLRPNHKLYIEVLRRMTPEQRLRKSFELTKFARQIFIAGLRQRHPDLPEAEFRQLVLEHLRRCHNRNY
jgi:hypothetical protein